MTLPCRRMFPNWVVGALAAACGLGCASSKPAAATADAGANGLEDATGPVKAHWSYEGAEGPEHWGMLSSDYALCGSGQKQSPIDMPASVHPMPLSGVAFAYAAAPGTIVDNGHTVQVDFMGGSNSITVGGTQYNLLQFHFHKHSEHTVGGASQPLEIHLVHQAADKSLAVLGIFYKVGAAHAALNEVFEKMPMATQTPTPLSGSIDPTSLLPTDKDGWIYDGSLTT